MLDKAISPLTSRLAHWLATHQQTGVAITDKEREAIFRLRYEVYVHELGYRDYPTADHERGWITDELDTHEHTRVFYVRADGEIVGTVRVTTYRAGELDDRIRELYSLDRFPDIDTRTVAVGTKMMLLKRTRGGAAMLAMATRAADETVTRYGADMMILDCAPALIRPYRRLGLRPYGGRLLHRTRGVSVPLVCLCSDLEYLRDVGSPWYHLGRDLQARGKLSTRDLAPLRQVVAGSPGLEVDRRAVAAEIEQELSTGESFLGRLSPALRTRLSSRGILIDVEQGAQVVRPGAVERDLYVVVAGAFEMAVEGRQIQVLGPGDVFGEQAFFHRSGQRTAAVSALTQGRLLMLRHGALEALESSAPAEAIAVYKLLAEALAERVRSQYAA